MQQRLRLILQLAALIPSSVLLSPSALAQVTSDGSLPTPTEVETSGNDFTINGGTTAGNNLFHSFRDFSVPAGGSAIFNNASSASNIINRVTGGNISQIDGLIQSLSDANLFLINPAGIIFGEGSSLNIGGSFYGSTGQSILFPDGVEFDANPAIEPILTINAPIGFNVRENSGDIINRSVAVNESGEMEFAFPVGLAVEEGESITFEANQIIFDEGLLTAPGGSINLRALGNIEILGSTDTFDPSVNTSSDIGDGGAIQVNTSNGGILISDTNIESSSFSFNEDSGGSINIFAQEALAIKDTTISSTADGIGEGGNVRLESATSIALFDTRIDTGAFGDRRSGDIQISALNDGTIDLIGRQDEPAAIFADAFGNGEGLENNQTGGDLTITGGNITIDNYQLISRVNVQDDFNPNTSGDSGDISITGKNIAITNNSALETLTLGEGAAGGITIKGNNLVLDNASIEASNLIPPDIVEDLASGDVGNINLQLERLLSLRNNSSITAEAENNASGGNINIDSQFIVAFPVSSGDGNDLIASAEQGRGGTISFTRTDSSIFGFNIVEERETRQPNINDIDVTSQQGVDGDILISDVSLIQFDLVIPPSVGLIDSQQTVAYSCEAETNASGLTIKGKGGVPEPPTAPLRADNVYVEEESHNSKNSIENTPNSSDNSSAISIETKDGTIELAMGAIVREDGTVSLVGEPTGGNTPKQISSLRNCL